jgi:GAF domain-containing protein
MIVPLVAREQVFGALMLVYAETGKHYDEEDLRLAQELARRAAIAVDNARLYEQAQSSTSSSKAKSGSVPPNMKRE